MAGQGFAEQFRAGVNRPGPRRHVGGDPFAFGIVEHRLTGAGKDDLLHAGLARRFKGMIDPFQIHRQQPGVEVVFVRDGGQMNHGLDAVTRLAQRVEVSDVGGDEFVVAGEWDGLEWGGIEQPQGEVLAEQGNDFPAYASAGSGDENAFPHAHPGQTAR